MAPQLAALAAAMLQPNAARVAQDERTARAQQEAVRAAEERTAALGQVVVQLQAQRGLDRAGFQDRIMVLERTGEVQRAQLAALEALHVRRNKIAALVTLEAKDTAKMQRFIGEFFKAQKEMCNHCCTRITRLFGYVAPANQLAAQLQALQTLVNERLARPDESVLDPVQGLDTEQLKSLDKLYMLILDTWFIAQPNTVNVLTRPVFLRPRNEILVPMISDREARVR